MKIFSKYFVIVFLLGIITNKSYAASYVWTGSFSTAWNNANNWSPTSGFPGTSDNATIVSASNMPVLDQNRTISALTVTSGTLNLNTFTLQCNGNVNANGGTLTNGTLKPRGNQGNFIGTYVDVTVDAICGSIKLSGGTYTKVCKFEDTSLANSSGDGGCTFNDSLYITHTGSNSKTFKLAQVNGDTYNGPVVIRNTSNEAIWFAVVGTSYFNNNIIVNSTGSTGVIFGISGGISELASGKTISVGSSGFTKDVLTLLNFKQLGSTAQTITVTDSAAVNLNGCTFNGALTVSGRGFLIKNNLFNGNVSFTKTGPLDYHSYGGNCFKGIGTIINNGASGRIRLATTSADTMYNYMTYSSSGQAIQVGYSGNNEFKEGIEIDNSNITFNNGSGTIIFGGSSDPSMLLGGFTYAFGNLTINKSAGYVHTASPITVDNSLTLTNGYLRTDTVNVLTMKAGSTVSGASNSSYISGPVKKVGNTSFTFPVGKNSILRPIQIGAPSTSTDAYRAEFFDYDQRAGENRDDILAFIDDCSHWKLHRTAGSSNVSVTLTWGNSFCPVLDTTYLRVASWYSNNWNDKGHGTISGNYTSGSITTSSAMTNFSTFALAYDSLIVEEASPDSYVMGSGFVENIGQLLGSNGLQQPQILYYGNAGSTNLFLGDSVFYHVWSKTSIDSLSLTGKDTLYKVDSLFRVAMRLKNMNSNPDISMIDTSQGYNNYFIGDSSYTHALTYQKVTYYDVFDDIDLSFFSNDMFRFNLGEDAHPSSIAYYFQGADSVKIVDGNLKIYSKIGTKTYTAEAYEYDVSVWLPIDINFVKTDSVITFNLGSYTSDVLMINIGPVKGLPIHPQNRLKWSTYYANNTPGDQFTDVDIDYQDNIYVIGTTNSNDFPVTNASNSLGASDVGVVKFKPDRSQNFATYFGGEFDDFGNAIVSDNNGNVYFTGQTFSPNSGISPFPICSTCGGSPQTIFGGTSDGFVAKLSPDGSQILMSTYFGGAGFEIPEEIAIDNSNKVVIVGSVLGGSVPTPVSNPGFSQSNSGNFDCFLAQYATNNSLIWSTQMGGDQNERGIGVTTDYLGNIIAYGSTNSDATTVLSGPITSNPSGSNFPIVQSAFEYVHEDIGGIDNFVCLFTDHELQWSTMFGGTGNENSLIGEIEFSDLADDIYITGSTVSSDFPIVGLPTSNINISSKSFFDDAYIVRFDVDKLMSWSTYFGGIGNDRGTSLTINSLGDVYFSLETTSDDLTTLSLTTGAFMHDDLNDPSPSSNFEDGFIFRIDKLGLMSYATYFGGSNTDQINGVGYQRLFDNQNDLVVVGTTSSSDYPLKNYPLPNSTTAYYQPNLPGGAGSSAPFIGNLHNSSPYSRMANNPNFNAFTTLNEDKELSIYPNPSNGVITFSSTTKTIQTVTIIDNLSRIVYISDNIGLGNFSCELSNLESGVYTVKIDFGDKIINRKIVFTK